MYYGTYFQTGGFLRFTGPFLSKHKLGVSIFKFNNSNKKKLFKILILTEFVCQTQDKLICRLNFACVKYADVLGSQC